MSKKAIFLFVGCFVLGLMLGITGTYVVVMPHYTKLAAGTFFAAELMKIGEAAERSSDAYKHESKPVAIYALSQFLNALRKAEEIPESAFSEPKRAIYSDMMLTHGRLAKLYTESGETNLSAQHVAEALSCSRKTGWFQTITNQAALAELVAKIDQKALK